MDNQPPISEPQTPSFGGGGTGMPQNVSELLKNKWVLIGGGVIVFGIILMALLPGSGSSSRTGTASPDTVTPTEEAEPLESPTPTLPVTHQEFTPEQLEKIEAQNKVDEQVEVKEREIKTKYPWYISLPLRGDDHFVYFDTNTETFVALLYPHQGDDVEVLKGYVVGQLKEVNKIPIEEYTIEWKITYE